MKLLPSPSCSSSSSFSSSAFDANICNPKGATPGCLTGILRRILCSGSLPTHPSDQITEEANSVKSNDKFLQVKNTATIEAKSTAGIVARLMGLDSMPEKTPNLKSISRTQSMSSVDHLFKHLEGENQQVRSTLSFREIPTFLELENENFFILSFEREIESKELKVKERREEKRKNRGSKKTEKMKKKKRMNREAETKDYIQIDLRKEKKPSKKNTHKVESESSSDESSPVSVLKNPETPFCREKKTSSEFSIDSSQSLIKEEWEEEICRITEAEMEKSNWKYGRIFEKGEEFEGVFAGFELRVVDRLIDEFVEEMYDLSMKSLKNL